MLLTIELVDRLWHLRQSDQDPVAGFASGAQAYDTAAELAHRHHARTGQACVVQVAVASTRVEALRVG